MKSINKSVVVDTPCWRKFATCAKYHPVMRRLFPVVVDIPSGMEAQKEHQHKLRSRSSFCIRHSSLPMAGKRRRNIKPFVLIYLQARKRRRNINTNYVLVRRSAFVIRHYLWLGSAEGTSTQTALSFVVLHSSFVITYGWEAQKEHQQQLP
ncbi:MAG: hypothetical protein IPM42_19240 [Saprospiraceae bacterium]|nr:hypothetical protein [Saprospiraceae bacterium]